MQPFLYAMGLLASLALSFISSGMETALYRVSKVRQRIRSEKGDRRARAVLATLAKLDAMVTSILIDNNIAAYAGTYFLSAQLAAWRVPHAELVTTAVITPVFFVFTESLPKQLAYGRADSWAPELIRIFSMSRHVLSPMVWLLNRAAAGLRRLLGSPGEADLSQSQRTLLLEHLSAGVAENVLSEEQNRMAARIMQMEEIRAGGSMVPLERLVRVPAAATRSQALREMAKRHQRLALLVDAGGKPTGEIVTVAALIMTPGAEGDPVRDVSESVVHIRAGVAISEVLNLFRRHHSRNALVTERGRVVGLITTQSVLDGIAGIART